LVIGNFLF